MILKCSSATSPELLSQVSIEKQVYTVDLISYLSVVRAKPYNLSTAVAVNAVWTMLGVLAAEKREQVLLPTLQTLVRMCMAFPPLMEECIQLLGQAASMWISTESVIHNDRLGYCLVQDDALVVTLARQV